MKMRTIAFLSMTLLATILLGAFFAQTLAQTTLPINVVFDPKSYTLDGTPPPWNAEIWRQKIQDRADYATIKLEDLYTAVTVTPAIHGPRLIVNFSGTDVKEAIFAKISHMGILYPGVYNIKLKVSGNLLPAYGGDPFEGYGKLTVTVP